ncbi:BTB/POZ and TAZ domain-containing protein 1 [Vitis vinifera]|uniref:BTB/POZ and TAZ domain-containing protein 1 n=1 Tax=Vitis vinifera TaxID=29760 RepID=A0A438CXA9_VITVI|nr:BTB/POZ and TAZ domain-containing protein 1 [Vitis vinifera]
MRSASHFCRRAYKIGSNLIPLARSGTTRFSLRKEISTTTTTTASPPFNFSGDMYEHMELASDCDQISGEIRESDVYIVTSGGLRIPANASVLASVSPVLENILDRPRKYRRSEKIIPILGVPCDAVLAFVRFLYSSRSVAIRTPFLISDLLKSWPPLVQRLALLPDLSGGPELDILHLRSSYTFGKRKKCTDDEMETYGIHLLALSHVFLVPQLKQRCTKGLAKRLTNDNVVDVLQLARLCDAPDLYIKCMRLISDHFKTVEKTEGWMFLQDHDPISSSRLCSSWKNLNRKKRSRRRREERCLYMQLSEAMECLEHICTEGCTSVGPYHLEPTTKKGPCGKFSTCHGLQMLIKHFGTCKKRVNGGCSRCKRMWQLLRLHSSICDQTDLCRVPLCRQFKLKAQQVKKGEDARWKLLVRKVVSAKAMSSLSLPKRKREEEPRQTLDHRHGLGSFRL